MARIDWIEQRLQNWVRWRLSRGSGQLGYASVDLTNLADSDAGRDGYITATIPTSDIEAAATEDAVVRLPSELKATVECVYLGAGTLREKMRRLAIAEPTLHTRIGRAHRLLADHFLAQQGRQRAERERVERLRDGARPGEFYTGE
jgi:DNA-directed RNA polymerase specialized sigma24 family protein